MKNVLKAYLILASILTLSACNNNSKPEKEEKQETEAVEQNDVKHEKGEEDKTEMIDTLRGIDVSHFQGNVNWDEVKAGGMHFGIAKATQGMTYVDPEFANNWKGIMDNGLYRGCYHFYVAADDPIKQAENFVNTIKELGQHHLPPALDLEGGDIGGLDVSQYQANVLKWLTYVEKELNIQPMIYTNGPFGNEYLDNKEFSKYKLWIAEYGSKEAHVPKIWEDKSWSGWQFTSHDQLKGVNGSVDESKFLSSLLIK